MIRILFFTMICALQSSQTWATMRVTFEDIQFPIVNTEYFSVPDAYPVDGHEDKLFLNYTVIKPIPRTSTIRANLMGAVKGAFINPTGIDVTTSLCAAVSVRTVLSILLEVFGFTKEQCIPPPGVYTTENYEIGADCLPDNFAPNQYMTTIEIYDGRNMFLVGQVYANIQ